ncbi:MAG: triose-phosphate isomerase [Alphaproteobacteria bacterium]|nr:triose-phosphate isomerase [Alphaproteobacteria bacterium]
MTTERQKLVAGNWKMNGLRADGLPLARDIAHRVVAAHRAAGEKIGCELLICPPATLLALMDEQLAGSGVLLGGQDCHHAPKGAHTGDISAEMLKDFGCSHVILGHSERRTQHGESDAVVRRKLEAARRAGLIGILCLGESEAERNAGRALEIVAAQLAGSLPEGMSAADLVVAYEPIWAIGTGRVPTIRDVAEMHAHIRKVLSGRVAEADAVRILYGGSVKPENAKALLAVADVDGALVGGASLVPGDFWEIARSCG